MAIIDYLHEFNAVSVFVRLLLSVILGGLIGVDRGRKHQAAGVRTFALVCLGSCIVILTNEFICIKCGGGDTSRMAAQVISGIGFLGAGTIMVTSNNRIRGLTTAALLWVSAILGLCIGSGLLAVSLFCFGLIFGTLKVLQVYHDRRNMNYPIIELYLEVDPKKGIQELRSYAQENFFVIKSIHRKREKPLNRNDLCISVEIDLKGHVEHNQVLLALQHIESIHYTEEV